MKSVEADIIGDAYGSGKDNGVDNVKLIAELVGDVRRDRFLVRQNIRPARNLENFIMEGIFLPYL